VKILHVDTALGWRGGQNQALLTARGMAERGHRVLVACRRGGRLAERAAAAGLDVASLRFGGDLSPFALGPLRRLVQARRFDVLQLHDPHALLPGVFAARGSGAALLATRRVDFPLRGAFSRAKYRRCAAVICVSRRIAEVLSRHGLPERLLRVVYEGVPDRPPQPGGREALAELGVPREAPVVGNVAALVDHKDHATLLEAAARLCSRHATVRLVIVGDGELRGPLESRARALGLQGRVVFAGFRNDLDRLIPAFDVFCLSSHLEGLGTSLLDAMAFARPIVATAAGGIPEAVEHGKSGLLVPVRDAGRLADALFEVVSEPGRATELGAAGRRAFERRFDATRMVEETLRLYEELRPSH
jgi:L-malate glycosyltransferase